MRSTFIRSTFAFKPTIVLVALVMVACGTSSSSGGSASGNFSKSSTLSIRVDGDWATFNPSETLGNLPDTQIDPALYDRLVFIGADGKAQKNLASSWEVSPTRLTFTLNKSITCADGTPLTASAVANHFKRLLGITDPKTKSAFALGEFGPGPFTVSADDAKGTFTLNLGTPFSEALDGFAFGSDGYIVCPKATADPTLLNNQADGTGPYTIASQDRGSGTLTLKLRSDWNWGPGGRTSEGLPGTLVFKVIANETTAANALLTGQVDIARITTGADIKRLLGDKSLGVKVRTPLYTNPMWLNINPGHPTADVAVREALVTAVSGSDYNQATYGGFGTPVTSLFSSNAPCYEPKTATILPKTNVDNAKQVLRKAGYSTDSSGQFLGKDGKPLTVEVVGDTGQRTGVEYFTSQFNSVGIKVNPVVVEHVVYSANYLAKGIWDVIVPGIASDTLGGYMLFYFGKPPPEGGRNYSWMTDPTFQAAVQQALAASGAQACSDWKQVQLDWMKNYYGRPLSAANFYFFYRNPKWSFDAIEANMWPATLR